MGSGAGGAGTAVAVAMKIILVPPKINDLPIHSPALAEDYSASTIRAKSEFGCVFASRDGLLIVWVLGNLH